MQIYLPNSQEDFDSIRAEFLGKLSITYLEFYEELFYSPYWASKRLAVIVSGCRLSISPPPAPLYRKTVGEAIGAMVAIPCEEWQGFALLPPGWRYSEARARNPDMFPDIGADAIRLTWNVGATRELGSALIHPLKDRYLTVDELAAMDKTNFDLWANKIKELESETPTEHWLDFTNIERARAREPIKQLPEKSRLLYKQFVRG